MSLFGHHEECGGGRKHESQTTMGFRVIRMRFYQQSTYHKARQLMESETFQDGMHKTL